MTRIGSITVKPLPGGLFRTGFQQGWIIENGKKIFAAFVPELMDDGSIRYERMDLPSVKVRALRWLSFA